MLSGMCSLVMRDRSKLVSDLGLLVMIRVCSTVRGTGPTGMCQRCSNQPQMMTCVQSLILFFFLNCPHYVCARAAHHIVPQFNQVRPECCNCFKLEEVDIYIYIGWCFQDWLSSGVSHSWWVLTLVCNFPAEASMRELLNGAQTRRAGLCAVRRLNFRARDM